MLIASNPLNVRVRRVERVKPHSWFSQSLKEQIQGIEKGDILGQVEYARSNS